jgi:hypothetical protein
MTTDLKKRLAWPLGILLLVITTASCSSTTGGAMTGPAIDQSYNQNAYGDHWVFGENKHDPYARDYD